MRGFSRPLRCALLTCCWLLAQGCGDSSSVGAAAPDSNRSVPGSTSEPSKMINSFAGDGALGFEGVGVIHSQGTDMFGFGVQSAYALLDGEDFALILSDSIYVDEEDACVSEAAAREAPIHVRFDLQLSYNDLDDRFALGGQSSRWSIEQDLYIETDGLAAKLLQGDTEIGGRGSLRFISDLPRQVGDQVEVHVLVEFNESRFVEAQITTAVYQGLCEP